MITEGELARHCPLRTFQRARQIANHSKNMLTKQVRYESRDVELSAFVASSSGWNDRYRTSVTLSEDEEHVIDYSCTCPAFLKYDGMCKHSVALALAYIQDPTSFLGYKPNRTPETSPSIAEFMRRAERVSAEAEAAGSISLAPTLTYGYENWSVRFKVHGPRGSYVVKSISNFANALREESFVTYGKKLAFTHTPSLFDERSRALAQFIERAATQRERRSDAFRLSYYRSYFTESVGRDINLTEGEVIELLDILKTATFDFECTDSSLRRSSKAHVVDADPRITLRITRADQAGYLIRRDEEMVFAAAGDRMYLLQDDMFFRCSPAFTRCADFLRSVYRSSDDQLFITPEDMPLFCSAVLPLLEETLDVDAPRELELLRPVPARFEFYFDYAKKTDCIEVDAQVLYGEKVFALAKSPSTAERERAEHAEAARAQRTAARRAGVGESAGAGANAGAGVGTRAGAGTSDDAPPSVPPLAESPFAEPPLSEPPFAMHPLRDEALEQRALKLVQTFFNANNTLYLDDADLACELLFGGLSQFRALGEVFTTPAFDRLVSGKKPRVSMGLSLAGNLINLDVSATDLDAGELASLLSSYRKRKRFHRLRDGAYLDLADHDLGELERLADDLGISTRELVGGHVELPTYRAFYLDREFADAKRDASFESYVARLENACAPSTADAHGTAGAHAAPTAHVVPTALANVLRPYQREGFQWLCTLADMGFGGILADEMGLGKSVQLISLLLARAAEARDVGPSLIVCPASLVYNWVSEFATFAPELHVRAVEGAKRERERIRAQEGTDVLIASYDIARIDVREFEKLSLFCCTLDEAQYIKNHATLTTRAVKRLNARHRFALTGTPVENRLSEVWSIFDFLMPGFLGSYARFRERFELGILGGDEALARRLQSLVGPFVMRRCKTDVLPDLPDKLEQTVYVALGREQRRLYDAAEQKLREDLNAQKKTTQARSADPVPEKSRVEVLAELMKLRQIALDPALAFENFHANAAKTQAIVELVEQTRDAGSKALVFSQFTTYLERLAAEFDALGIPYLRITGATPKKERLRLVNAFNADDTPAFLISLKAGGTGLNLTGASVVIHADPWWNAAATNQATDRAHRIGQKSTVSVYKVIATGTIEERILALQEAKSELAESVIGGVSAHSLSSLTSEELLELLEG